MTHRKEGALGIRNSLIKRIPDGPASSVKLALHTVSRNKCSADENARCSLIEVCKLQQSLSVHNADHDRTPNFSMGEVSETR